MLNPLISIIIPTYNRHETIAETLDSVLTQSYPNWECLVVDDGSTDNTLDIVKQYAAKDPRIKVLVRPSEYKNGGCGARNFGFIKAEGDYIKWLDSDDLLEPLLLEKEVMCFSHNPEIELVYCGHTTTLSSDKTIQNPQLLTSKSSTGVELLNAIGFHHQYILTGSYTVKKKTVLRTGDWNEEIKINQDGEFLFRLLTHCRKTMPVDYLGFIYRVDNNHKITSDYNNLEKVRLKLKSWELIDAQIKIRKQEDLQPYITHMKNFLYKYHLHMGHISIVAEFHSFFKDQIKSEKRKGIKFKLFRLILIKLLSS